MASRASMLALGTFAIGTESLGISGILGDLSESFGVRAARAGLLVIAFAATYAIAAALGSFVTSRFAPRTVLVGAMGLFFASNLLAAAAPSFAVLVVARMVAAVAASSYTPNASAAATSFVAPEHRGRALATVYAGLSVASLVGVPLGALLGQLASWRVTMAFVAVVSLVALVANMIALPAGERRAPVTAGQWSSVLRAPKVAPTIGITAATMASHFVAFTFMGLLAERVTGRGGLAPVALLVFGAFSVAGNSLGGRLADRRGPDRTIPAMLGLLAMSYVALSGVLSLESGPVAIVAGLAVVSVWGLAGWAVLPSVQLRLVRAVPHLQSVALSVNASALYLGIAAGGLVGGRLLDAVGVAALGLGAAGFAVAGLVFDQVVRGSRLATALHTV